MAVKMGERSTLVSGPNDGVWASSDPFDGPTARWRAGRNIYCPAPNTGSDSLARPGFTLQNSGGAVYTSATPFKGQGGFTNFDVSGTPTNWCVFGGHLFRQDPAAEVITDVTPAGVTIDGGTTTRVHFASLGGVMCVTDGVNRPWVASNLSSTPITGTYIDFDGSGTAWTAFGAPTVFGGAGFFILNTVNSVGARLDIAWCEPNDWTTGYQQSGFDDRWTLEQTGTTPLFAISGTNVALYYWRQRSIGSISGTVGQDLATTATHDAISVNVGTEAPATVAQFGNSIYFVDLIGRPWSFTIGSAPHPIWQQLRSIVDSSTIGFPGVTALTATGAFDPTLNQYCAAIWSPAAGSVASPTNMQVFDANSGVYEGQWSIGPADPGVSIDALFSWVDNQGRGQLIVQGSAVASGVTGFVWGMSALNGVPDLLVLEDGTTMLTLEDDVTDLTTEGQRNTWLDNNQVPLIQAMTDRLGYSEDIVWLYDKATVLTGTDAPVSITITTPNTSSTVVGTPTPNASDDGIYRTVCNLDLNGRGAQVTVSPTTATEQWSIARVSVVAVPNPAADSDD